MSSAEGQEGEIETRLQASGDPSYGCRHRWPLLAAVVFFLLVTACHWVALPTLITWDGHEYLELSEMLGSDRFPHDWSWLRAPLLPLGLKLAFTVLGRNPLAAKGIPLGMAVLGCLLLASCVRQIAGVWAAAFTLVILAVYPTLIVFEHAILTETGIFFFLAFSLRLSLWTPKTARTAWIKVVSLGLVLGAGYYWKQSVLVLAPWFALLHLLSARDQLKDRRGFLRLALQAIVLLLVPWLLKTPWSRHFEVRGRSAYVVQAFAIKQALFPADDRRVAPVKAEYLAAIEQTERNGALSGMPWIEASRIAEKIERPSSSGALTYLAPLVAQYPTRYAAGVGRTLLFFAGFGGTENSIQSFRALVLSPKNSGAMIGEGPEPNASRFKQEFFHRTTPGLLQRGLWSICGLFDRLLIICNFAAVALLMVSIGRRKPELIAISGTPVVFAAAHAVLLFSIDRFMVPIYPITLACGIVAAAGLIRRFTRSFGKEVNTMANSDRASRAGMVTLASGGLVALLLIYSCGSQVDEQGDETRITAVTPASTELTGADEEILSEIICGRLDGAKLGDDGSVFLWGWAYDPRHDTPASAVILLDNGKRAARIPVIEERPDVAQVKGNPRLRTTGWNFRVPATERRKHAFEAYAVLADGKLGRLGGKLTVSEFGQVATSP